MATAFSGIVIRIGVPEQWGAADDSMAQNLTVYAESKGQGYRTGAGRRREEEFVDETRLGASSWVGHHDRSGFEYHAIGGWER